MPENNEIVRDILLGLLTRFPQTPSLTLAKKAYKENQLVFRDVETARGMIRYYRGQHGKLNRSRLMDKTTMKSRGSFNPFGLPKSYSRPRTPIELKGSRFLLLYDAHIPYHDTVALETAITEGKRRGCDSIFLGGDTLDCHLISNFVKEPTARKFQEELDAAREFIGYLRHKFPKALVYYKEGNHEERFWKYMRVKAPELLDVEAFSMQKLLGLEANGVEWVHGRTKSNIGKLSVFHGHEFGKTVFSPVNPARGLYMRTKTSSVCGHYHQSSEHTETDANGKIVTCWSIGGLSELSPEYRPYNNWNHGFAIVERHNGDFSVHNKRIYRGKVL